MKKILVFVFPFFVTYGSAQDTANVYGLSFKSINSTVVNMFDFAGKQILVVEFAASSPDRRQLVLLDSLYKRKSRSLQVIGIPVNNSDTAIEKNDLVKLLRDSLRLSFIICDVSKAKKNANSNQHVLLKWFTHKSSNKHFDNDISDDGRMFLISRNGILYASLGRLTSLSGTSFEQVLYNEPSSNF
ncbi:MAG: hypothetical protein JWQ09_4543 [Segetibacter sp.]|nr:hypothetical protein [Segetibacter sp.]